MGNRVKGRVKPKSIKAASFSTMGSKRKLSRMGKKQKKDHAGLDATFIGRSKCLTRLQISLKDFRRLCILKGIYPREPRGRFPGNKKGQVYYHIKDVKAISHEPILDKFRDFKAFMKKVRKCAGRNEKDEAKRRLEVAAPSYTLYHLVRERYPRFVDALGDLDDALALSYLFAALPSKGRIQTKITRKAAELTAAWGTYCAISHSVTKSFISVKGVYMETQVKCSGGIEAAVRWIMPHSFTQYMPTDVDYRVMVTFFEFYEVLLGFVLYKLYNELGIRYPFVNEVTGGDSKSSTLIARHLNALRLGGKQKGISGTVTALEDAKGQDSENPSKKKQTANKSKDLILSVQEALNKVDNNDNEDSEDEEDNEEDKVDIGAPLKAALENLADEQQKSYTLLPDSTSNVLCEQATKRKRLFAKLTFFLSREIPRGYLELIILSYGGNVGWEAEDSPISANDPSITHHIIDRPKLPSSYDIYPKSREYVQPQWVLDCSNFMYLLPCSRYGVGVSLPPHLSPWVDDEEEGYTPAYKEEVQRIKNGEIVEVEIQQDEEEEEEDQSDDNDNNDEAEELQKAESTVEKTESSSSEDEEEEDEEEEEEEVTNEKQEKKKTVEAKETKDLAKVMMSKKAKRLYGRMQHGIAAKQEKVEQLHRRRKVIEHSKKKVDGKSLGLLKVERLKQSRKKLEDDYGGHSMKRSKNR